MDHSLPDSTLWHRRKKVFRNVTHSPIWEPPICPEESGRSVPKHRVGLPFEKLPRHMGHLDIKLFPRLGVANSLKPQPPSSQSHVHHPKIDHIKHSSTQEKAFEEAKPVITALKKQGVSSVGAAGYCWGGKHCSVSFTSELHFHGLAYLALRFFLHTSAKVVAELAKANVIQAAVMSHPCFVTVDDIKEVKFPIAVLGAETDMMSPPELVKQFEKVLSSSTGIDHLIKIFPEVSHGWTVRYDSEDAAAVERAEEALADMTDWFNKNLKLQTTFL
ncbi:hypothetical protein ACQ4PT_019398 [Festuca glaucescens]